MNQPTQEQVKFTKGPWAISSSTMIVSPELKIVANCTPLHLGATVDLSLAESVANANLINAAPDLYEALKELRKFIDFDGGYGFGTTRMEDSSFYDDAEKLRKLADAALLRAEGKA